MRLRVVCVFLKEFVCGKCSAEIVMVEKVRGKPYFKNACKCGIHRWEEKI